MSSLAPGRVTVLAAGRGERLATVRTRGLARVGLHVVAERVATPVAATADGADAQCSERRRGRLRQRGRQAACRRHGGVSGASGGVGGATNGRLEVRLRGEPGYNVRVCDG